MERLEILTINGQIFHETTIKGLPGLRVEAWDKDRISKGDYGMCQQH